MEQEEIVARMEAEIRPLLDPSPWEGGYNCCGCSTYADILDHAIAIVRGEVFVRERDAWDDDE
jgi:hypothetical protein